VTIAVPIIKLRMKLYLFGGAELQLGQGQPMISLIREILVGINPKQVLYIPFARRQVPEGEEDIWGEGWFVRSMRGTGIEILDAQKEEDVEKAHNPVILVSGGRDREYVLEKIRSHSRLRELVYGASIYVGESSGTMILGEYLRKGKEGAEFMSGLGILKNTIIEPHYRERNYQQLLRDEMKKGGAKYGVGIDCVTGIVFDLDKFPDSYEIIGEGSVEVINR